MLLGLGLPIVGLTAIESFLRREPMSEWFMETVFEGPLGFMLAVGMAGVGNTLGWTLRETLLGCLLGLAGLAALGATLAIPRLVLLAVRWRRRSARAAEARV